jgi:hypothetical protein
VRQSVHTSDAACRLWRCLLVLCALSAVMAPSTLRAGEAYAEDEVKAAFIFRFVGYVRWPEDAVPARFTIAVLGADDVAANLQALLGGRPLLNRPVLVRRVDSLREATDAQVLFIGHGDRREQRRLAAQPPRRGTLVITESANGMPAGSMINLLVVDQRVRFQISQVAAQAAALKISSDLLALALRGDP